MSSDDECAGAVQTLEQVAVRSAASALCKRGWVLVDAHTCECEQPKQPAAIPSTGASLRDGIIYEDRFFILKSLTTDDLDTARAASVWATQPKNEPVLDRAFHGVRRSCEDDITDKCNASEFGTRKTPEVQWKPLVEYGDSVDGRSLLDGTPRWGKHFWIEWIYTTSLPFDKCKHLFNSWNGGKPDGTEVETTIGKRLMVEFSALK
ncbi:hypothetical protein BJ742DRAFT_738858 [Cladochytrium replicatum]|nr:hypothetical protein BJ742DRAFT_738858 [Cladochytrium replicatum]